MPLYRIFLSESPCLLYDSSKNAFSWETGQPLELPNLSFPPRPFESDGKDMRILMGTKCNYNCSYCSQAFSRKDNIPSSIKDVDVFLCNLDSWLDVPVKRIEFWGGEPLVYFKFLKKLVPALRIKFPKTPFTIVSNGSILTDEMGDFFAKYHVLFFLSHDSYGQAIRGDDPLNNPEQLEIIKRTFAKINKSCREFYGLPKYNFSSVSLVYSKACLDPIKAKEWLDSKFGETVNVSSDPVMGAGTAGGNKDVIPNERELQLFTKNVFEAALCNENACSWSIHDRGRLFLKSLIKHKKPETAFAFCSIATNDSFVVDLKGNLYPCQNFVTAKDVMANTLKDGLVFPTTIDYTKRPTCQKCPVVMLCRGGCPLSKGNAFADTCNVKFAYSLGVFAAVITLLTGRIPYRIEGEIVRPKRELIQTRHGKQTTINAVDIPIPDFERVLEANEKYPCVER